MSNPLVSIITPTFNRAWVLPRAIKSVLSQTYTNFEHIIVDDVSTDNTKEVVSKFKDPRIKYIRLNYHKIDETYGAPRARNVGINSAKGKYIAFLDSDDVFLPPKLQKQVRLIESSLEEYVMVYSGFEFHIEGDPKYKDVVIPTKRGDLFKELLRSNVAGTLTVLAKRSAILHAGLFDEKIPTCEDWDLWIRLAQLGKIDFVPEVLAYDYIHGRQVSRVFDKKLEGKKLVYKKYKRLIDQDPRIKARHMAMIGTLSAVGGKPKDAPGYYLKSLLANPFQKGIYFHLIASFLFPKAHSRFIFENRLKKYGNITVADLK